MSRVLDTSINLLSPTGENQETLPIKAQYLALDEIRRDGGTQPRAVINWQHVKLLEEQIEDGQQLEPIVVFYDGESYWLADGFHRWHAHHNHNEEAIACTIYQGSRRDAVLYSVGANADHKPALPRSREDKRRAIMTLLNDPEWSQWSDREIARRCFVGNQMVSHLRKSICVNHTDTKLNKERKVQRGEQTYIVDTANIGKKNPTYRDSYRSTIINDHPPFAEPPLKITQLSHSSAVIEELENDVRERIHLQDDYGIQIAHHLQLVEGALVKIFAPHRTQINNRLGRIGEVSDRTVDIWVRDVDTMMMYSYTLKHQQVETVPMEREPQLVQVYNRLQKLRKYNLDPFEREILLLLERPVVFTPVELEYLSLMEKRHEDDRNSLNSK